MKGILVNYEYCTGCHSCEVACKKYLNLPEGEFGIKLTEILPHAYEGKSGPGKWEWTYMPVLTKACNMCEDRVEKGKFPMCVQHCQGWCMYHGEIEDLVKKMDGNTRWALLTTVADGALTDIASVAVANGALSPANQEKIADSAMDL